MEATRLIKIDPKVPLIVILTLHNFPPYRTAAHQAGADGFLDKAEWYTQLMPLLQQLFPDELLPFQP